MRSWMRIGLALGAIGLMACGSLADAGKTQSLASVTGSLTGAAAPAGAHVALVWRHGTTGELVVTNDTAIVNGQFSFDLNAPPPDDFFFGTSESSGSADTPVAVSAGGSGSSNGSSGAGSAPTDPGTGTGTSTNPSSATLHPMTEVSGTLSSPMTVAIAGFVVYVDANGNGQLDLTGTYASSPDTLIGGSSELFLAYLRGGTTLAYEKLRDKAGQLPAHGYNLFWQEGRVVPLTAVELELKSNPQLPGAVCNSSTISTQPTPAGETDTATGASSGPSSGATPGYPEPTDASAPPSYPDLVCSPDGRSFTYGSCPTQTPREGLCAGQWYEPPCARAGSGLAPGQPIPANWPCPEPADGGTTVPDPEPPVSDAGTPMPASDASPP